VIRLQQRLSAGSRFFTLSIGYSFCVTYQPAEWPIQREIYITIKYSNKAKTYKIRLQPTWHRDNQPDIVVGSEIRYIERKARVLNRFYQR